MTTLPYFTFVLSLSWLCLFGSFGRTSVHAFGAPVVVPLNGSAIAGDLISIDDNSIAFHSQPEVAEAGAVEGETLALPLAEFVRWGAPALPEARPWVLLSDGSLLVTDADWSGGGAVRTKGDDILALTEAFDEVAIPRAAVRGVVFDQRRHYEDRRKLSELVWDADDNQDEVLLTNGDRRAGDILELTKGSLTIAIHDAQAKLPISRVRAILFRRGRPRPTAPGQFVVGLRDGSILYSDEINGNAAGFSLTLADGLTLTGATSDDIVFLQELDGDAFVYLSDLDPIDYRHVPYLELDWPWKADQSVSGGRLTSGGTRYLKGIGMHSAARLSYRLDGRYKRFDASVALDDAAGRRGSVTFGVYVLQDGKWQEAYKSEVVRGSDAQRPISVDTSGAQGMTLVVDYADRGDELDRANWLDARLIKK